MTFFLALPAEIQDLILRFAVVEPQAITIDSLLLPPGSDSPPRDPLQQSNEERHQRRQSDDFHPAAQPPITRVCHTIRRRALPLFYHHNTFLLVIRHVEAAHQHYRACHQLSPPTKKSETSTQIEKLHPFPRWPPRPENLPTRFIRYIETSHVIRPDLQRFRIRHIFRRVDFEVEFEFRGRRSIYSVSPQPGPSGRPGSDSHRLHRQQQRPGYHIARVIPRSADGWVYGYVRRAKMWLVFYDDDGECDRRFRTNSGISCGLWRRLMDVKGLAQYDWGQPEKQESERGSIRR
jgi:hypothetical protein